MFDKPSFKNNVHFLGRFTHLRNWISYRGSKMRLSSFWTESLTISAYSLSFQINIQHDKEDTNIWDKPIFLLQILCVNIRDFFILWKQT